MVPDDGNTAKGKQLKLNSFELPKNKFFHLFSFNQNESVTWMNWNDTMCSSEIELKSIIICNLVALQLQNKLHG